MTASRSKTYIREYKTKYGSIMTLKYEHCHAVPPTDEKIQKMIDDGFIVETLKDRFE